MADRPLSSQIVRGRLTLVASGLIVALLLAEASLRMLDRWGCFEDTSGSFAEPHPLFGWTHIAGASGWAKRCVGRQAEWRTFVRMNSHGLRGPEIPYERRGGFRVLVLGDSYTEGLQVAEEETFVRRLEERLGAERPGCRIEVINAGHAAYGTANELLFYLHEGRKYAADLVLLVFNTENDVLENSTRLLQQISFRYPDMPRYVYENGRLVLRNFPMAAPNGPWATIERLHRWIARHSLLYRVAWSLTLPRVGRAHAAESFARLGPLGALLKEYPPEWEEAWRLTGALLHRLRRAVARDGARFAVAVVGGAYEVSSRRFESRLYLAGAARVRDRLDRDKPNRLITGWLRRRRIPYLPVLERFREHATATGRDGYYHWDVHWNSEGHALAADVIAAGLEELRVVPSRGERCEGPS